MSGSIDDRDLPDSRGSAAIERDVERTRARLSGTLDELRDRAQPGQLFEQVLDYAKQSGGGDMARNLGQQMRDNPLPLLLIGAGIGWLMLGGGNGHATADRPTPRPGAAWPEHEIGRQPGGTTSTGIGDAAGSLRDSIAGAMDSAAGAVGSAYASATRTAGSLAEGASDAARQGLRGGAQSARGSVGWLVSEQPLVLGALGLAAGAAIGALLPGTEAEDRLMGGTRDRLVDQARSTAEQGYEHVKEAAGEQLDLAKRKLDEGGLSPDRVGEALTQTARQVKEAVSGAAQDAAGQARTAIGTPAPTPPAAPRA